MADQGSGIKELMAAETRASQIVAEARIGALLLLLFENKEEFLFWLFERERKPSDIGPLVANFLCGSVRPHWKKYIECRSANLDSFRNGRLCCSI
jgi:hypothetical protein